MFDGRDLLSLPVQDAERVLRGDEIAMIFQNHDQPQSVAENRREQIGEDAGAASRPLVPNRRRRKRCDFFRKGPHPAAAPLYHNIRTSFRAACEAAA